ncbi:MAG: hypothetical protein IJP17_03725 [Clostridia bacterium]|nr:hypothetical protein [Clostridia bacterium]
MKKTKRKGYAAPLIVTAILLLYLIFYFGVLITALPGFWKAALAIIPIAMAGIIIFVCVERIKEIRSGEEDDLSKY